MTEPRNSLAIEVDNRALPVADRARHGARVPDTAERQRLERQRRIREIVFGAQDGILTTLGIVTGVDGATADRWTTVLTGALALLVGALSMGVGEYLGGKAEREVVQSAIEFEQREIASMPNEEFAEQVAYYKLKGFTDDEATMIVQRLEKNPEIRLHEMVRDEFGIDLREADDGGLRPTFAMMGSFALGALVPLLPYLAGIAMGLAAWVAFVLALAALFGIGVFAGRLSGRNRVRKGLELAAFGAAIFVVSWLAGHFVPPLFGRRPLGLG
ncbi:MAG: VIT1/CCC1 transporter family protein [Vulcanimicrobiaceae bacterium]